MTPELNPHPLYWYLWKMVALPLVTLSIVLEAVAVSLIWSTKRRMDRLIERTLHTKHVPAE